MPQAKPLQISTRPDAPSLTPAQKRFNTLIKQIAAARQFVAAWQESVPTHRDAYVRELEPLQQELLTLVRDRVRLMDRMVDEKHWTNTERATLRALVCEEALATLEGDPADTEMRTLFDKHSEVDFETLQRQQALAMKDVAEALTGLDLGEDDAFASSNDVTRRLQEGFAQREAEAAARAARAKPRRKTAAQARREAEAEQAGQSLREVFRKLASALHPDREPDEAQRAAKTALMQRANQAYAANDLLALLELQLQVEQIDASDIARASDARLKRYNQVLAEQLADLNAEAHRLEMAWRMEFHIDAMQRADPRRLDDFIQQRMRAWRAHLSELQREMQLLDDRVTARRWLKRQKMRLREMPGDLPF